MKITMKTKIQTRYVDPQKIDLLRNARDALNTKFAPNKKQKIRIFLGDNDDDRTQRAFGLLDELKSSRVFSHRLIYEEQKDEVGSYIGIQYVFSDITTTFKKIDDQLSALLEIQRWQPSEHILECGNLQFDIITGEARYGAVKTKLTKRQAVLLETLLKNGSATYQTIKKLLYPKLPIVQQRNIGYVLTQIKKKLGINNKKKNQDIFKAGDGGYRLICK